MQSSLAPPNCKISCFIQFSHHWAPLAVATRNQWKKTPSQTEQTLYGLTFCLFSDSTSRHGSSYWFNLFSTLPAITCCFFHSFEPSPIAASFWMPLSNCTSPTPFNVLPLKGDNLRLSIYLVHFCNNSLFWHPFISSDGPNWPAQLRCSLCSLTLSLSCSRSSVKRVVYSLSAALLVLAPTSVKDEWTNSPNRVDW